jgi:hypothetical protein
MRDVSDIFAELRQHPDVIEAVIWTREDVEIHIQDLADDGEIVTESIDAIMDAIDMRGWESYAIECGWETLYQWVRQYGEIKERVV